MGRTHSRRCCGYGQDLGLQGEVAIFTLFFALIGRAERETSCPVIELEGIETPRRR